MCCERTKRSTVTSTTFFSFFCCLLVVRASFVYIFAFKPHSFRFELRAGTEICTEPRHESTCASITIVHQCHTCKHKHPSTGTESNYIAGINRHGHAVRNTKPTVSIRVASQPQNPYIYINGIQSKVCVSVMTDEISGYEEFSTNTIQQQQQQCMNVVNRTS